MLVTIMNDSNRDFTEASEVMTDLLKHAGPVEEHDT